jgi:hypothetical protein
LWKTHHHQGWQGWGSPATLGSMQVPGRWLVMPLAFVCPAEALIAQGNSMGFVAIGGVLLAFLVGCLCCCYLPFQLCILRGLYQNHSISQVTAGGQIADPTDGTALVSPAGTVMSVTIPAGFVTDQIMLVQAPNGTQFNVPVPPGAAPGSSIQVQIPASNKQGPSNSICNIIMTAAGLLVALITTGITIWMGLGLDGRLTYLEHGAARGEPRSFYDILYSSAAVNNTYTSYDEWVAAGGQQAAEARGYQDIYSVKESDPEVTVVYGRETRWDLWLLLAWDIVSSVVFWGVFLAWVLFWKATTKRPSALPRPSEAATC